jgi:8-oxo-dGTP pyrophosphatase MutT (NUDIX family)
MGAMRDAPCLLTHLPDGNRNCCNSLLFLHLMKITRIPVFDALIHALSVEIARPLPGLSAQLRMSPAVRRERITEINRDRPPRNGGVLILLYPGKKGNIMLPLMQRPDYDGAHGGQVSFPGGKMEKGDRHLIDTSLREAEEELGIKPEQVEVLGYMSELYIWASNFLVKPVLAFSESRPAFNPDFKEVSEIIEAPVTIILDESKIKKTQLLVRQNIHIEAPYYEIDNKVVWGATAMMLSELSELIKRTKLFN